MPEVNASPGEVDEAADTLARLKTLRRGRYEITPTSDWLSVRLSPFLEAIESLECSSAGERRLVRRIVVLAFEIATAEHAEFLVSIGAGPQASGKPDGSI